MCLYFRCRKKMLIYPLSGIYTVASSTWRRFHSTYSNGTADNQREPNKDAVHCWKASGARRCSRPTAGHQLCEVIHAYHVCRDWDKLWVVWSEWFFVIISSSWVFPSQKQTLVIANRWVLDDVFTCASCIVLVDGRIQMSPSWHICTLPLRIS